MSSFPNVEPGRQVTWSNLRKWSIVFTTTLITFMVSFNSSVYDAALDRVANKFDVSFQETTLGIVLYVIGFGLGPLLWGPASELYVFRCVRDL